MIVMLLLQFQFTNTDEDENELIPEFCKWLCTQLYEQINTNINRIKINNKIPYLYTVKWIHWTSSKETNINTIMNTIENSFTYIPLRNNIWNIKINDNITLPHTSTSISRLIRFINYGDNSNKAMGIFTKLINNNRHDKLNSLWRLYIMDELGYMTNSKIISR